MFKRNTFQSGLSLQVPESPRSWGERFIYDCSYTKVMRVNTAVQREVDKANDHSLSEKSLTLKEISPKWFERLFGKRKNLPLPLSPVWFKWYFELDSPSKCVIGEAYGYSSSYEYTCKECDRLGWSFGKSFMLRSQERLEDDVNQFVDHWNTTHIS